MGSFEQQGQFTINAAGNGSARFEGPYEGEWWIERGIFVRGAGGAGANERATIYVGSTDDSGVRDATLVQTFPAIADENCPIRIPPFTPFFLNIALGTAGDTFTVIAQIRLPDLASLQDDLSAYHGAPDSLLVEAGFPNQAHRPGRRR